jgi:hypothetical protein
VLYLPGSGLEAAKGFWLTVLCLAALAGTVAG